MPSFEISLDIYEVGCELYTKEYRKTLLSIKNREKKNFTYGDYKKACSMIKKMMLEYNQGKRGGRFVFKNINDNNLRR